MSLLNKNFAVDDRVKIINTADDRLDGHTGSILGRSVQGILDFYIMLLDKPLGFAADKAVNLPESCLDPA